jgi:hypothetical protein
MADEKTIKTVGPDGKEDATANLKPDPTGHAQNVPKEFIAPGTENAPHTGLVEPGSPASQATLMGHDKALEIANMANIEAISTGSSDSALHPNQHPNDVKVKFNASGNKHGFETGSVQVVSKESAQHFEKLGIASTVKDDDKANKGGTKLNK